jgi:hypothetical protein
VQVNRRQDGRWYRFDRLADELGVPYACWPANDTNKTLTRRPPLHRLALT